MKCFRPLIRGFFFYALGDGRYAVLAVGVSVPSFGDSFFISFILTAFDGELTMFPSPHSGILFLSGENTFLKLRTISGFRPLIRGFFFYRRSRGGR